MKKEYPDILKLEGEKWHNPDPATGKLGTRVPAEWLQTTEDSLKSLTLEMLEVLKAAGINPNELNNTQVRDAIQKMILARVINYNDIQGRPVVKDSLGDDRNNPASQRVVNDVNRAASTAQKTANNAHALAQSKQDKLEFVGNGKVMKEGAYGVGGISFELLESDTSQFFYNRSVALGAPRSWISGVRVSSGAGDFTTIYQSIKDGSLFASGSYNGEEIKERALYDTANTTVDKSGFLRASGSADALTTSDVTNDLGTSTTLVASQALVNTLAQKIDDVAVDQIFTFESAIPPKGYIARNGQAIDRNAMPKLYARYGANMPDDRNRVHRMQGNLTGAVGSTQEDAMQKITGSFVALSGSKMGVGAISVSTISNNSGFTAYSRSEHHTFSFDSSKSPDARTSTETRAKSRIVIFCNKIQ